MSNNQRPIRVRFAPSPTGNLHVGGARTAIYNWAFARHHNGSFILRIEDTDPERSTAENTLQIMRSLAWLGLDWDEGPQVGGSYGSYLQSERFASYKEALDKMKKRDAAYPCFCTPEELAAKREQAFKEKRYEGYDRSCRSLSSAEAQERIASGEAHTWRLKIPLERGAVSFEDLVFGLTTVPISQLDDFILVRSDGTPTYNFAVCIDDILMEISHVIRGGDHLSNTPKQILVYEGYGAPLPHFAHLSMILGADGTRLSKRHGATSVEMYRDEGFLPDALLNYLALLGWSLDGSTTLLDTDTLCSNFSLERVSKNPAVFDNAKLLWVNQSYLKAMGPSAFVDALEPFLVEAGLVRGRDLCATLCATAPKDKRTDTDSIADLPLIQADIAASRAWYEAIFALVCERARTIQEATKMTAYLFGGNSVCLDEESVQKCLRIDGAAQVLQRTIDILQNLDLPWTSTKIEAALRVIPNELTTKPKVVFQAVRVAVCGNMVSPPLFESLELIGKEGVLARLEAARLLAL